MGKWRDLRDVIEGEFRKFGDWLSVVVEKEKEEKVNIQDYFLKKKQYILRKDYCFFIQQCEYIFMFQLDGLFSRNLNIRI